MNNTESSLINELYKSVEIFGVEGTTQVLKVARNNVLSFEDKRVDFVLKMVASYYNHTIEDIVYSRTKNFRRGLAIKFAVYYLYEEFGLSYSEIKLFLKRDKSLLSKAKKTIKEFSIKRESVKTAKQKFDLLVSDFKLKNNLT